MRSKMQPTSLRASERIVTHFVKRIATRVADVAVSRCAAERDAGVILSTHQTHLAEGIPRLSTSVSHEPGSRGTAQQRMCVADQA